MAAHGQNGTCRLEVEEAEEPERHEAAWQSYGGAVVSRLVGNLEWLESHKSVLRTSLSLSFFSFVSGWRQLPPGLQCFFVAVVVVAVHYSHYRKYSKKYVHRMVPSSQRKDFGTGQIWQDDA